MHIYIIISKLNEPQSWNEKDLKVTPEMDEKRKKYLESLDQPVVNYNHLLTK